MIPTNLNLSPGDLLFLPKNLFVEHVGVYLGLGLVLQNTPQVGEHVVFLSHFSKGKNVRVKKTHLPPDVVAARASERLQTPKPYDLLANNCEHTATAVTEGKSWSPQLLGWFLVACIIAFLVCRK